MTETADPAQLCLYFRVNVDIEVLVLKPKFPEEEIYWLALVTYSDLPLLTKGVYIWGGRGREEVNVTNTQVQPVHISKKAKG